MQMTYNEAVNKLKELDKVIYAFEQVISFTEMNLQNKEYINVPKELLVKEMELVKSNIQNFKDNLVVSYNDDLSYLDKLLEMPERDEWNMDTFESELILLEKDKLYEEIKNIIELNMKVISTLHKLSQKEKVYSDEFKTCINASTSISEISYVVLRMMGRYKL